LGRTRLFWATGGLWAKPRSAPDYPAIITTVAAAYGYHPDELRAQSSHRAVLARRVAVYLGNELRWETADATDQALNLPKQTTHAFRRLMREREASDAVFAADLDALREAICDGVQVMLPAREHVPALAIDHEPGTEERGVSSSVTRRAIVEAVAASLNVPVNEIVSADRGTQRVADARHLAMYLVREVRSDSLISVAAAFNRGDHTTVMHACKRMAKRLADPVERARADAIIEHARRESQRELATSGVRAAIAGVQTIRKLGRETARTRTPIVSRDPLAALHTARASVTVDGTSMPLGEALRSPTATKLGALMRDVYLVDRLMFSDAVRLGLAADRNEALQRASSDPLYRKNVISVRQALQREGLPAYNAIGAMIAAQRNRQMAPQEHGIAL
jgi:hypothetical protein